ncbi:protein Pet117p, mitochondrial [Trichomonascus vanleenenianus]|uniref:Pet117p n=1 Tax=Trichomonascus vanleenenianus TaxID=2268995 RepID=UPI003ECA6E38
MSRAAKITFAVTTALSAVTVFAVHIIQAEEREALHQGPIKDRERVRLREEKKQTEQQKQRSAEYELQKQLREEYSKVQDVSDPIKEASDKK